MHAAAHTEAYRASFTLESFIPDSSNRFALAAAQAVAASPTGSCYNPLLIYGPSGVGKTHLLHAIANEIRRRDPLVRVRYLRGDEFIRELIDALQHGRSTAFREKILETDLLLLDDMQFLAGKEATQEEFFHIFNLLAERGSQIVLASDRPPQDLRLLADRLVSRFSCGLMAELTLPEPELREEYLRRYALDRQLALTPEQISYISGHLATGTLQLSGVLNGLLARTHQPDMDMVRQTVAQFLPTPSIRIDSALVTRQVCDLFRIDPETLRSHSRIKGIGSARMAQAYLLAELCDLRLPQIAAMMERDLQTVAYLLRKADKAVGNDIGFRELVKSLREAVLAESQTEKNAP